jgi:hypothetical protein
MAVGMSAFFHAIRREKGKKKKKKEGNRKKSERKIEKREEKLYSSGTHSPIAST